MLPLLVAAGTAIASYAEQEQEQQAIKARSARITRAFNDAIMSDAEIAYRTQQVGSAFDGAMQDTANAAAVSARTILNPQVMRAISVASIQSQKIKAMVDEKRQDENFNTEMRLKAANAEADGIVPNKAPAAAIAGAMSGYQIGSQINGIMSARDYYDTQMSIAKGLKFNKEKNIWE